MGHDHLVLVGPGKGPPVAKAADTRSQEHAARVAVEPPIPPSPEVSAANHSSAPTVDRRKPTPDDYDDHPAPVDPYARDDRLKSERVTQDRSTTTAASTTAATVAPPVNDYGPVVAFSRGRLTIVYFGIFVGVGAFLGMLHTGFYLGAHGLARPVELLTLLLAVAIGAPFTAFMLTRILDIRSWLGGDKTFSQWARTITFSLWGGLQGGFSITSMVATVYGISPLILVDAVVLGLPLAQAVGRVGCLNYGCCYGRPCSENHRFAIRYQHPATKLMRYDPSLAGKALFPSPVFSTIINIGMYATLLAIWSGVPDRRAGLLAGVFMVMYGAKRFLIEFTRADFPGKHPFGLTFWQVLSLVLMTVGSVILTVAMPRQSVVGAADASLGVDMLQTMWPVALIAALVMMTAYSVHGRKIGSW